MILPRSESFICLSYSTIEFLVPKKEAITASFCEKSNFLTDEKGNSKIIIDSKILPYVDVDIPIQRLNQEIQKKEIRTCIVITCKGIFEESETFGIVTSSDCKVLDLDLGEFSLFSEKYNSSFQNMGLVACNFDKNQEKQKLRYLIDINKFFKKYQEILL